jgi:hypothetical protein
MSVRLAVFIDDARSRPHFPRSPQGLDSQRFIAVTSRQSSGPQRKLMPMESRNDVDGEAVSGEDTKTPREARIDASERMAASFPIIARSYEPV